MINPDVFVDLIVGLIGVLSVVGMVSAIIYCFVYGYSVVEGMGLYSRIKYGFVQVLLNILTLILIYTLIFCACVRLYWRLRSAFPERIPWSIKQIPFTVLCGCAVLVCKSR